MAPICTRASAFPRIALPLLAGLLAFSAGRHAPQAAEAPARAYAIPADEGYGLTECLNQGGECARVVADAWCESHGHAHALALGKAEDAAAVIPAAQADPAPDGAYVVTCGE